MPKGKSKHPRKGKKRSRRPDLSNLSVICPMCAESYLETTDKFTPKKFANAGMLRLKKQFTAEGGGNQWTGPPPDPTAGYGMLECPGCEAPLASEGYLKVAEPGATIGDPESVSISEDSEADVTSEETIIITSTEKLPPLTVNGKGQIKEWHCPHCERIFKSEEALESHIRLPHVPPIVRPISELEKNYSGTPPGMEMVILCAECERSFKNKQALSAHMKVHKKK